MSIPVCAYTPVPEELLFIPLVEERPVDTFGEPVSLSAECLAIISGIRANHAKIRRLGEQ